MIYHDRGWQDKIFDSATIEEMIWEITENAAFKRGARKTIISNRLKGYCT